jgi:hypothetical protein
LDDFKFFKLFFVVLLPTGSGLLEENCQEVGKRTRPVSERRYGNERLSTT